MSDDRLRALERRWQETGAAEDEAALINERARAGLVTRERIWSAGLLGSAGARLALGQPPTWGDELRWVYAIEEPQVAVRATLLLLQDFFSSARPVELFAEAAAVMESARAWLRDPSRVILGQVNSQANACNMMAMRLDASPLVNLRGEWPEWAAVRSLELAAILGRMIHNGAQVGTSDLLRFLAQHRESYGGFRDDHIRLVLQQGLIPSLLGHDDPINIQAGGA